MHPLPVNSTGTQPHDLSQKAQRLSLAPGQKHGAGCCSALSAQADPPPTQVYLDSSLIGKIYFCSQDPSASSTENTFAFNFAWL